MRKVVFNDPKKAERIIKKCKFCFVGMIDLKGRPYVLPFNFGYKDETIWFHSGRQGRKSVIFKQNPEVCITFSTDESLKSVNKEVACSYSMRFRSVLAYGKVEFVDDYNKKTEALNIIMKQYTGKDDFSYNKPAVDDVMVFKVKVEHFSGKESGY
jgi:nitroimidazol reductase NimA-like FMN-containing flavoprotein (pyridoxamine 5'-phosphate oxidase superfamily)